MLLRSVCVSLNTNPLSAIRNIFYTASNAFGYFTVPLTPFNPSVTNSIPIKTLAGTSKGALMFYLSAGTKPNFG